MANRRPVESTEIALELPETAKRYEGSITDFVDDLRGAERVDMSPRAYENSIWDDLADREGQRRLMQQANKSRALATWRNPASRHSAA